ncbi:hypothetical protein PPACK8108_LOCUS20780 [Phakopsora pachyrhizi]|uniref:Sugar phosphate transporter domain-containing protein n=1 Tax=Phakopsora pachyrhizi TaxID=170000 RepID=A0AAV0BHY3_PHAPC|nr:hypothetical protein PPACK8108_LOCUS20780 [Phakopsora pachyrhizi]
MFRTILSNRINQMGAMEMRVFGSNRSESQRPDEDDVLVEGEESDGYRNQEPHHHHHHQEKGHNHSITITTITEPSSDRQHSDSQPDQRNFPTWLIISLWIILSSIVIFYNSFILNQLSFSYPITLTTLHLGFQTLITQLLIRFQTSYQRHSRSDRQNYQRLPNKNSSSSSTDPHRNSSIDSDDHPSDDRNHSQSEPEQEVGIEMSLRVFRRMIFWKKILPISILFSVSLVLSNAVYLYLSVSFIQMIKAASPVAVLLTLILFGLQSPSFYLISIVLLISFGIGLASYGEVRFNLIGFIIQIVAILVEANRVVLIQILLGTGISPLNSLYLFAPVCFMINLSLILPLEGLVAIRSIKDLGLPIIISNSILTFLLNLSSVYLIQCSSLVLSLSKVLKDLILIISSNQIMLLLKLFHKNGSSTGLSGNGGGIEGEVEKGGAGEGLNVIQWVGYIIALVGLILYKRGL